MQLTILGCSSPFPEAGGATPGYLLELDDRKYLLDCGSGVLSQLARYIPPYQLDGVLLSHLHHDHITDFFILQYAVMVAMNQGKRTDSLPVWAPTEPADWYRKLSYSHFIVRHMITPYKKISLDLNTTVQFFPTEHPIPCYAMFIESRGRKLLYGADSGIRTNWKVMGKSPDVFIAEASFLHKDLPSRSIGHLSARQAGEIAEQIQAKKLILTHIYPELSKDELFNEASRYFSGECILAEIGMQMRI